MTTSDSVIAGLNTEISLRRKKITKLEQEIESLCVAVHILNVDPELEKLLDEEDRIEAEARTPELRQSHQ